MTMNWEIRRVWTLKGENERCRNLGIFRSIDLPKQPIIWCHLIKIKGWIQFISDIKILISIPYHLNRFVSIFEFRHQNKKWNRHVPLQFSTKHVRFCGVECPPLTTFIVFLYFFAIAYYHGLKQNRPIIFLSKKKKQIRPNPTFQPKPFLGYTWRPAHNHQTH